MQQIYYGKVRAVITTYKREPSMLLRAVSSVLCQTYPWVELVIVDDSPADFIHRAQIAHAIDNLNDSRITYLQNETNTGACASRNRGAFFGSADYIAFLDDDDEWLPEKLESLLPLFTDENVGMAYGLAHILDDKTGNICILNEGKPIECGNIFRKMLEKNVIGSTSYPLIRASVFYRTGGFCPGLPALQDWELWLRITKICNTAAISKPLTIYHSHSGDHISTHPEYRTAAFEYIRKLYAIEYAKESTVRSGFYAQGSQFYAANNQFKQAISYLLRAGSASLRNKETFSNALFFLIRQFVKHLLKDRSS